VRTFFITCHRSRSSVADLFRILYRPDVHFIIHCDPKAPADLSRLVASLAARFPNVRALAPRPFSWAGYSMVEAVMDAMRFALAELADWNHFFWISEQHLPLRGPDDSAWALSPECSYAETMPVAAMGAEGRADIAHRFCRYYRELPGVGAFPAGQPDLPPGFLDSLHHGSKWMVLSRRACGVLLRRAAALDSANPFRHSLHADETMLQTLLVQDDGERLPVQQFNPTYIARPHLSGSQDMIFRPDNVRAALSAGCLFIRKRPDRLDDDTVAFTEAFAAMTPTDLEKQLAACDTAQERAAPERSIEDVVAVLREFIGQAVIWQCEPGAVANAPACYFVLKPVQAWDSFRIGLFSEDLRLFKVVVAVDQADVPPFADALFRGHRTTALRVRIHDFFLAREIEIEGQQDHGFFDWPSGGSPDGLRNGLQKAIDAARAFSNA
jgi:Core-2/I-Branching enzyme